MVVTSAVEWISQATSVEMVAIEADLTFMPRKQREKVKINVAPTSVIRMDSEESTELVLSETLSKYKTVQFADPLVTQAWEIPRVGRAAKKVLFYTNRDISRFRQEHRTRFGQDNQYDRVFCEQLVENLDQLGQRSFVEGDLAKALEAFNHALRVRTQTHIDFDARTTSRNIHCIADIYSKQKNWSHALDAYLAALFAIRSLSRHDNDVIATIASIKRKVLLVRQQLGLSNESKKIAL